MKIVWSENAKNDLQNYKQNSKIITAGKVDTYINNLIEYVNSLSSYPELGKFLFNKNDFEIRQLIYNMHKIFYGIKKDTIYILVVSHTSRNPKEIIKAINSSQNKNESS